MKKRPFLQHPLVLGGLVLLGGASTGLVGDALGGACLFESWLGKCDGDIGLLLARVLIPVSLFVLSGWGLYHAARQWPFRHLAQHDVEAHRVLIAAVSNFPVKQPQAGTAWIISGQDAHSQPVNVSLGGGLQDDIAAFSQVGFRWGGQQFLRALAPHVEHARLEHLVLIGSPGEQGSFKQLPDMETLARRYTAATIHRHTQPVDFENIESLQQAFNHWIEHFTALGLKEQDIVIDVTGGQKTTSIAAALTTLHRHQIEFQYVQTGGDPPRVIGYNVVIRLPGPGAGA